MLIQEMYITSYKYVNLDDAIIHGVSIYSVNWKCSAIAYTDA